MSSRKGPGVEIVKVDEEELFEEDPEEEPSEEDPEDVSFEEDPKEKPIEEDLEEEPIEEDPEEEPIEEDPEEEPIEEDPEEEPIEEDPEEEPIEEDPEEESIEEDPEEEHVEEDPEEEPIGEDPEEEPIEEDPEEEPIEEDPEEEPIKEGPNEGQIEGFVEIEEEEPLEEPDDEDPIEVLCKETDDDHNEEAAEGEEDSQEDPEEYPSEDLLQEHDFDHIEDPEEDLVEENIEGSMQEQAEENIEEPEEDPEEHHSEGLLQELIGECAESKEEDPEEDPNEYPIEGLLQESDEEQICGRVHVKVPLQNSREPTEVAYGEEFLEEIYDVGEEEEVMYDVEEVEENYEMEEVEELYDVQEGEEACDNKLAETSNLLEEEPLDSAATKSHIDLQPSDSVRVQGRIENQEEDKLRIDDKFGNGRENPPSEYSFVVGRCNVCPRNDFSLTPDSCIVITDKKKNSRSRRSLSFQLKKLSTTEHSPDSNPIVIKNIEESHPSQVNMPDTIEQSPDSKPMAKKKKNNKKTKGRIGDAIQVKILDTSMENPPDDSKTNRKKRKTKCEEGSSSRVEMLGDCSNEQVLDIQCTTKKRKNRSEKSDVSVKRPPGINHRKMCRKIFVPVKKFPGYNFIDLILGPHGNTLRRMEKETGAKIRLCGTGISKSRKVVKNGTPERRGNLHVLLEADNFKSINSASKMLRKLLLPVGDEMNKHKQAQLKELASLRAKDKKIQSVCGDRDQFVMTRKDPPCQDSSNTKRAAPSFSFAGNHNLKKAKDETHLFVQHLPSDMNDDRLFVLFSAFGTIEEAYVVKDRATGLSKGYGFVKFSDPASSAKAIAQLNRFMIYGKTLLVKVADPPPAGNKWASNSSVFPGHPGSSFALPEPHPQTCYFGPRFAAQQGFYTRPPPLPMPAFPYPLSSGMVSEIELVQFPGFPRSLDLWRAF